MFINWLECKWNKLNMYIINFFQYHICRDLGIIDVSLIFLYICTVYITLVTVPDWDEGRWEVTTSEARINGLLLTRGGRNSSEVFDLKKYESLQCLSKWKTKHYKHHFYPYNFYILHEQSIAKISFPTKGRRHWAKWKGQSTCNIHQYKCSARKLIKNLETQRMQWVEIWT